MTSGVKVSGAWKNLASASVKVAGAWKTATGYVRVAGAWKQWTPAGGGGVGPCTIAGSLSASGSTNNIAGTAQAVTVALGNTGRIQVRNLSVGSGDAQVKVAAGPFTTVVENDILTFVSTENIQCRGFGMSPTTDIFFDLYDVDTNTLIRSVVLTRT